MGGRGSGRARTRIEVEVTVVLDVRAMMRSGRICPGARTVRLIEWGPEGAPPAASVRMTADMGADGGHLTLVHPGGVPYLVEVISTPQPFGGRRWWLVCPVMGQRTAVLYLPTGAAGFASRQAHRLGYRSQRLDARGRAVERAIKARSAVGGETDLAAPFPKKPKRMRWATYERHRAKAGVDATGTGRTGAREAVARP